MHDRSVGKCLCKLCCLPGYFAINLLHAFEENNPFAAYKTTLLESKNNWSGISKFPCTVYMFGYYIINLTA